MKRLSCAVLSLLLWACGPEALPEPSILSVVPDRVAQGGSSALSVKVNAVLPFAVDYGDESAQPLQSALTVKLGGQEVDVPFASADGTLIVPVPRNLELGDYGIQVALADGRAVNREPAFSVVMPSSMVGPPDGRDAPRPDEEEKEDEKGGFQIDSIGDQVRDVPFRITVRAPGGKTRVLEAPVSLRASHGQLTAVTPATIVNGVLQQEVSISTPGARLYLMAEDAHGNRALSNPFHVRPH